MCTTEKLAFLALTVGGLSAAAWYLPKLMRKWKKCHCVDLCRNSDPDCNEECTCEDGDPRCDDTVNCEGRSVNCECDSDAEE